MAQLFFGVSDQLERKFKVVLELVMRGKVVSRDPINHCARFDEILVPVPELHGLGGAPRRSVLGVEVQNDDLSRMGLGCEFHPAGCDRFEFGKGFVDSWGHEMRARSWHRQFQIMKAGGKT
jgi:hypothetical protein